MTNPKIMEIITNNQIQFSNNNIDMRIYIMNIYIYIYIYSTPTDSFQNFFFLFGQT